MKSGGISKAVDKSQQSKRQLKYMPITETINYTVKNRKLLFLNFSLRWFLLNKMPLLAEKLFHTVISERIADYAYVHQNIGLDGKGRILDVGCHGSKLPIELASLGYEVWGIDVEDYPLEHPNFAFVQGDICQTPFPDDFFDCVTLVSTLEHIGLGRYKDPLYSDGDKKAIDEIHRILNAGGKTIVTVPFGKRAVVYRKEVPLHRVYDFPRLTEIFCKFKVEKIEYLVKTEGNWFKATLSEAKDIESGETPMADALIVARKEVR